MTGLKLVESLTNPQARDAARARGREADRRGSAPARTAPASSRRCRARAGYDGASRPRAAAAARPRAPRRRRPTSTQVWALVNPQMLYGKHLGLRGSVRKLAGRRATSATASSSACSTKVKEQARSSFGAARGVAVLSRPDRSRTASPSTATTGRVSSRSWVFPRQATGDRLCLADFVLPEDHVALFVTTAGDARAPALAALEGAGRVPEEPRAGVARARDRRGRRRVAAPQAARRVGLPRSARDQRSGDLLGALPRQRYSFGYPACPDLAGQRLLFELLRPADIGVELTEGDMMDPEASVSALVLHHPEARYFGV